ncbi:5,10-methylenetetrahydrofolate reductase [Wenyingzhuangia fucanilytica]|uniref:Methylenetetrahydrofolate reductase n=1 Tax=Wenyingzhuangia fucanilytica TaxID=1790137 RepID=A0A1B1Y943_9FLAO|nr:methylenetetrahydrofolate reductase [Wenyingzhuangia fucanilytica]ANW97300.1 5,10-methylenetetrahydrofolate reductase [Wenyingzhuangia fucanilytica]
MNSQELKKKIENKEGGYLFYGLTPPKISTPVEKIDGISQRQIERIKNLPIDGLVLYDIQDESSRTHLPRPFPFLHTWAPDEYANQYLQELNVPKIIYKSVGKFTESSLKEWLVANEDTIDLTVFVGAPSKQQQVNLSLQDAYKIKKASNSTIKLGGVTIPERHFAKGDEHIRLSNKIGSGCTFFISQCVYNLDNAKSFLSDYHYKTQEKNIAPAPIIFTLTPCGSVKTLEFTKWLGIDIPRWLENDLTSSEDILAKSIEVCKYIAKELIKFAKEKNMPIGFNIESVAIRKAEIEASIELVKSVKEMMI